MSASEARPTYVRWTRSTRPYALGALLALFVLTPVLWTTHLFLVNLALWGIGALIGIDSIRNGFFLQNAGSFSVEGGALHVKAGRSTWQLRGENLVGASSSRGERGWDLTLQARGELPITLQSLDEASVQQICEVLGIGSAGFGEIAFRPRSSSARAASAVGLGMAGGYALLIGLSSGMAAGTFAAMMLPFALLLLASNRGKREPVLSLSDLGLGVFYGARRIVIPWQALTGVQREANALVLHVAGQQVPVVIAIRTMFVGDSLSPQEADLVEAQVRAALERSRGLGRPRRIDATGTSELLSRGQMNKAEWHAHLDRLAAEMAHGGGYRSLRIDRDALHEVLLNPDAEALARVGAARILARVEGERVRERIEVARASMHEEEDILAFEDALAEADMAPGPQPRLV